MRISKLDVTNHDTGHKTELEIQFYVIAFLPYIYSDNISHKSLLECKI